MMMNGKKQLGEFIKERLSELERLFPKTVSEIQKRGYNSYSFESLTTLTAEEEFHLNYQPKSRFYAVCFTYRQNGKITVRYDDCEYGWTEYNNENYYFG